MRLALLPGQQQAGISGRTISRSRRLAARKLIALMAGSRYSLVRPMKSLQTRSRQGVQMSGQVQGKVALITGGASGIGAAVAELLAREGASVVITDIDDLGGPDVVAAINKECGHASFLNQDVTSELRWIEVVAEVAQRHGRLDILVSNAGIGIAVPTISEMSLADWRRQTAINLDGVFLSVKHGLPAMRKTGGGSGIMMSSLAGLRGSATLSG